MRGASSRRLARWSTRSSAPPGAAFGASLIPAAASWSRSAADLLAQGVDMTTHSPRSLPPVRAGTYTRRRGRPVAADLCPVRSSAFGRCRRARSGPCIPRRLSLSPCPRPNDTPRRTPAAALGACSFPLDACPALFAIRGAEPAVAYCAIKATVALGIGMALGVEVVRRGSAWPRPSRQ